MCQSCVEENSEADARPVWVICELCEEHNARVEVTMIDDVKLFLCSSCEPGQVKGDVAGIRVINVYHYLSVGDV